MRSFKDFAINTKLSLLVLLASGVALFCSSLCFVLNDVMMIRSSMVQQTSALADMLAANTSAAVEFDNADEATKLLESLKQQRSVVWARIYNASDQPFVTYRQGDESFEPVAADLVTGHHFAGNYLNVVQRIQRDDETIGLIYLRASIDELRNQLVRYVAIVAVMVAVSLAVSIALSSRFQRVISVPILNLANAAKRISSNRDYGIRVEKTSNDELGVLYEQFNSMLDEIQKGEAAIQRAHDELEVKIYERTAELSRANKSLSHEITVRTQAEHDLENAHQKLMDAARRAGMAEIATGVLHNVGNVLNSINVSATLVSDRMRQSKVADLMRAVKLMEQHAPDLGKFITEDPKGKQLPGFLNLLANHLADERADIVNELEQLTSKVGHVKTIVSTQQSYAGVSGVIESVDLSTTLDDAMKLNMASFERHKISVVKDYQEIPKIRMDKQKVLQILVNLIKNAKESLSESENKTDRKLVISTSLTDDAMLQIRFSDNGLGIRPEDLTRIFTHGFTTKATGHGFGLHSCANAAKEMGGSLVALSKGLGKGASFVLSIPYDPVTIPLAI
jgi:two-component system NtrC family sensor kinase